MYKRPSSGRRLTTRQVERERTPGRYGDGHGGNGLSLLIVDRGGRVVRYWQQRLRIRGRSRMIGLGNAGTITLKEARAIAQENADTAAAGDDPRQKTRGGGGTPSAPTFEVVAREAFEVEAQQWSSEKTGADWWKSLEASILPTIGSTPIDRVEGGDVHRLVVEVHKSGRVDLARRLLQRVRVVVSWAISQGHLKSDPTAAVKLPRANKRAPKRHRRSLHHSQVADALVEVQEASAWSATRALIQFTALTATRAQESRLATWDEVDLDEKVWRIGAERMKTRTGDHEVPLSAAALAILHEMKEASGGTGLVFTSPDGGELHEHTAPQLLRRIGAEYSLHGLRSSFRSWCADSGEDFEAAESALAHSLGGATVSAYQRSKLVARRRPIMERWAQYVTTVPSHA